MGTGRLAPRLWILGSLWGVVAAALVLATAPAANGAFASGAANGRIAFTLNGGGGGDIYSALSDGSGPVNLTRTGPPIEEERAAFSPDGQRIAYTRTEGGATMTDVFVMRADGVRQAPLIPPTTDRQEAPAFSPDGRLVAFIVYLADRTDV